MKHLYTEKKQLPPREERYSHSTFSSTRFAITWFIEGSAALCLFQGAFPARLKKVLIVGAPVWFRVPYNLLSLLLKEKLRERVCQDEHWSFSGTNPCSW